MRADDLGAFAAPAAAWPVLVLERDDEPRWVELLLGLVPPRPVRFVPAAALEAVDGIDRLLAGAPSHFALAAAGGDAAAAMRVAVRAAPGRVVALLLLDPRADPAPLPQGVPLLVVGSGRAVDPEGGDATRVETFALPQGEGRADATARVRARLAAPPWSRV